MGWGDDFALGLAAAADTALLPVTWPLLISDAALGTDLAPKFAADEAIDQAKEQLEAKGKKVTAEDEAKARADAHKASSGNLVKAAGQTAEKVPRGILNGLEGGTRTAIKAAAYLPIVLGVVLVAAALAAVGYAFRAFKRGAF